MEGVAGNGAPRKVMIIADPGREASGALQWALSHAVMEHDQIILLHVETQTSKRSFSSLLKRPSSQSMNVDSTSSSTDGADSEFLDEMRSRCQWMQPRVRVHVERVTKEGKDKAATILKKAKKLSIDLIVIGQRRNFSQTFLGGKLSGASNKGPDTAEYLIENSSCLCVGVSKKGSNAGYVLNTKTHKNFWLLA